MVNVTRETTLKSGGPDNDDTFDIDQLTPEQDHAVSLLVEAFALLRCKAGRQPANNVQPVSKCLFEDHESQPPELANICNKYANHDGLDYQLCATFLNEVEAIGYTFDYGLEGVPFDLRPIGTEIAVAE